MKFVQNNKFLWIACRDRRGSAEKAQLALASLRFALRALRLCVEIVFLFGSGYAGLGRGEEIRPQAGGGKLKHNAT